MVDSSRLDVDSVEKEKDVVLDSKLIPEPQRVYIHDEASLHEIRDEIGALRHLFYRRQMNDKQKNELIQTLTDGATFAFIEPFIHDIILLLDRIERSEDEVVRSIRDELLEIFMELKKEGVAVFFSTHIISDLEKCADDIVYLSKGKLVAASSREAFMEAFSQDSESLEETMLRMERGAMDA